MPVADLVKVCSPPARPHETAGAATCDALEATLGRALPADYRTFVATYGVGAFGVEVGDAFFDLAFVVVPDATDPDLDARELMPLLSQAIADIGGEFPELVPYPAWPEPGGLLYVGGTTTSHCVYWRTDGAPDDWTVVVCDRPCDHWYEHAGDLTSYLAALARGHVPAWITEGVERFPLVFRDLATLERIRIV